MLKTIFDFILSLAHLFFRAKKKERQFCTQCGALVGRDGACRACDGSDGGDPGGCRCDPGGSRPASSHDSSGDSSDDSSGNSSGEVDDASAAYAEEMTQRLIGWALIGMAVIKLTVL
ncbi:hypothetical protein [Parabacteroides sp. PF5-6]|uniref:hypothetical protein n=1 Tax=Parabacteroides sp. PF5-6 TaxID=1742403 RepID=UPI00240604AF|nr:hypothetical protein [Parabacteroides sp. PF5-6]MDF9830851.1 hypothetical protein [Parabacteroides sp. PF5-6]